jgi:hypothetical protein
VKTGLSPFVNPRMASSTSERMLTPREGVWWVMKNLHGAQARRGLAFALIKARHTEGGTRCPYYGSTPSVTSIGWSPSRWPGYVVRREASRWMPSDVGISSSSISICPESIRTRSN